MKKLLLICFLSICASINTALCQTEAPLVYTEVVQVEGVSKDELYNRAKNWVVKVYNNPQKVIQLDDKAAGQISVKGLFNYNFRDFRNQVNYTMSIYVKDGRYKYEMSDRYFTTVALNGKKLDFGILTTKEAAPKIPGHIYSAMQKLWTEAQVRAGKYANSTLESLKEAMQAPTEAQSDEW